MPSLPSSWRDPSGFVFEQDGVIYRQVNLVFREDFDAFINSGCYRDLLDKALLLPHEEVHQDLTGNGEWYKTLKPERLAFVSYPYEWSFDMLKDAALLTLRILRDGLKHGIILKDASAYNIQWKGARPVFIDTLSFERYDASVPWVAYRQFCEQFLAPLLLAHYSGHPLQKLLLAYPEGIPLALTSSLLPSRSKLSVPVLLHLHLNASMSGKKQAGKASPRFSQKKLENLVDSLAALVRSLKWKGSKTTWEHYYDEAANRPGYLDKKIKVVEAMLGDCGNTRTAVDLGANEGTFALLTAGRKIRTVACDMDHNAVNRLYLRCRKDGVQDIFPLVADLSHPSPAIGLNNEERPPLMERFRSDLALALALVHHLCIGKNIPFEKLVSFLEKTAPSIIIEFVPKEDEKVQLMLQGRKDIFGWYTEEAFLKAFEKSYMLVRKSPAGNSGRTIYLFRRHA